MRWLTVPEILGLQSVKRYHTVPTTREQTVADHSAVVALLAVHIAGRETPPQTLSILLLLGLQHDAHEAVFGDIPYPARMALLASGVDFDGLCMETFWGSDGPGRGIPNLLTDLVHVADKLEAALFARKHAPAIAGKVFAEAQAAVMDRLKDQPLWAMRARAMDILKEAL